MPRSSNRDGPRPVGDSLDRVVGRLGGPSAHALSAVFAAWPAIVGESVAAHARPASLRGGTLVVAVDEAAWAASLRWLEADLLARIAEAAGEGQVGRIELRVVAT